MPIRPELRKFYRGPGYEAFRARIVKRARNRCEQCGVPNRLLVERGAEGVWRSIPAQVGSPWRNNRANVTTFEPHQRHWVWIVCTLAHLNHVPGDDRDDNAKFLCQWCHLNYDKLHHKETRSLRKDAARPLLA